jgi:hypothetical protein
MAKRISKKAKNSKAIEVTDPDKGGINAMSGPSTDPATNLLIADVLIRGATRFARKTMHEGVLKTTYSADKAKELAGSSSVVSTLALYGITRLATRSVPGALLVSGGLLAKTLYDRGKSKRLVKKAGKDTGKLPKTDKVTGSGD